jgi:hypothetical protein
MIMSKYSLFSLALLLTACFSEKNVDPANAGTFMRYYSDGFANEPVAVEETPDGGLLILVNSNFKNTDAEPNKERIQLIKTDQYGHQEWAFYYPDNSRTSPLRWKASSMILAGEDGYLVIGEEIEGVSEDKRLLIFTVNSEGTLVMQNDNITLSSPWVSLPNLSGKGAAFAPSTNGPDSSFYILAQSFDESVVNNIYLAEVRADLANLDSIVWSQGYEGGSSLQLTNKLYYHKAVPLDGTPPYLFWGGSNSVSDVNRQPFVTQVRLNNAGTENGFQPFGTTDAREFALDFCPKGNGFGFIGYQEVGSSLGNIFFCNVSSGGAGGPSIVYIEGIFNGDVDPGQNVKEEKGNSITATDDGGYIIHGTIDTYTGLLGRGNTDMFMMKIDGAGGKVWSKTFGTPDIDAAVSVRQTLDGGYVLLGRTRVAALQTVVLIKTDKEGNVD